MPESIKVSNTNHKIFGRGKGFPRMYQGKPCLLDAVRIILAGGVRSIPDISVRLKGFGWFTEESDNSTHYLSNILSKAVRKNLLRRESKGRYKLKPGDSKPIEWVRANQPDSLDDDVEVPIEAPAPRRRRHEITLASEGNGSTNGARRLRGKLDFCWPGTERPLFTVKFEIYPSSQSM